MNVKADLDEMVFRARNKEYGAYVLRKVYTSNTLKGLLIATLLITLSALSMSPWVQALFVSADSAEDDGAKRKIAYADLSDPPPINDEEPPPPPPTENLPPPPARAQVRFVPPEVVKDEDAKPEDSIVNIDTFKKNVQVGATDIEGDPDALFSGLDGDGEVQGPVEIQEPVNSEPDPDAFVVVEKQPEPVNMDAFKKSLQYPAIAKEAGIEGIVSLRILVDKYGKYVKHKVLRSPHPALTKSVEENITMLKFTPGIQAGKPITVWVNVPVRFKLNQ